MTEFKYAYPPQPIATAPKFFKSDRLDTYGLVIYGYAIRSNYPEDAPSEEYAWAERNSFLSYCYSIACPDGELGFTRAATTEEITEDEFLAAAERRWK